MLELRLLGQFEVLVDGTAVVLPSRAAQSLFAYLAITAGTLHRRERLAALLWPDAEDDNARSYLRHALWRIRKAIEAGLSLDEQYLLADELTLGLNPRSEYALDVAALERVASNPVAGADELLAACAMYRGELLPGFNEEWVVRERNRVEALFERQMDRLVDSLVRDHRWPEILEWSEKWIALGHAPEPAFRALMLAHARRGDRAQVAIVYCRCRGALFEELGAVPSEETRVLFERLSRGVLDLERKGPAVRVDTLDEAPSPGEPPFQACGTSMKPMQGVSSGVSGSSAA
jgi:DNA-binding SARP family transcriptional activator